MFKPIPMRRVSLQVLVDDAPAATLVLARAGVFDPVTIADPDGRLSESPADRYRELFQSARTRFTKIPGALQCVQDAAGGERVVPLDELERLDQRLGELWHEFSALEEDQRRISDQRQSLAQLGQSLSIFTHLNVDLGHFRGDKGFLSLHVGTVPAANLDRLREAASLAGHVVAPFHHSPDLQYVVVAGPKEAAEEMNALLRTAGFRAVTIPEEFRDYPEQIRQQLDERARALDTFASQVEERTAHLREEHRAEIEAACRVLRLAEPYAELATRLRGRGSLVAVEGWIPRDELPALQSGLGEELDRPFVMTARPPRSDELDEVPSVTRHHRLLRPFAALVRNYGVPRYGEFDPTLLFAVTFVAMFGMMFGDIGHGAVFVITGFLLRKRFPVVLPFMVAAGVSSMVFGVLYGSIFGYEELFHALWLAPLSDPLYMLEMALYWGIGFILLATALTVYNRIAEQRYAAALFDNKGVAGILLYLGGLYGGFRWVGDGVFGLAEGLAILAPLFTIMVYKWHESDSPVGERVLVVFVEGFESVMNYLANTLSFLRVAAFSLNHVALAVAVFTMAGMMDTFGHWVTVVLGNIFIIGLEGAIVTIQVLRLEYYEGFSRFFSGDGREFRPLRYQPRTGA